MPKFTVTVELYQTIELELESPTEKELWCSNLHETLSEDTKAKLREPNKYGIIIDSRLSVEEVNLTDYSSKDYDLLDEF